MHESVKVRLQKLVNLQNPTCNGACGVVSCRAWVQCNSKTAEAILLRSHGDSSDSTWLLETSAAAERIEHLVESGNRFRRMWPAHRRSIGRKREWRACQRSRTEPLRGALSEMSLGAEA